MACSEIKTALGQQKMIQFPGIQRCLRTSSEPEVSKVENSGVADTLQETKWLSKLTKP